MPATDHPDTADEELLRLLKAGDETAFAVIYNRYFQRLYNYTYRMLKEPELCKDIVQETFVQIWHRRREQQIRSLGLYLHAVVRFQAYKAIRSQRIHEDIVMVLDHLAADYSVESRLTGKDMLNVFYEGVSRLPERCRSVFHLSRVEQLSNSDIAIRLSIAPKTVVNQLTIALQRLRVSFKDHIYS